MNKFSLFFFGLLLISTACSESSTRDTTVDLELWKSEIVQAEKDFNDMAREKGLVEAFRYFAADDAVIMRNRKIIHGKMAIAEHVATTIRADESLTWKPSFVDVSKSGDLAYTYGDFTYSYPDSLGNKIEIQGIFHTVWKRQLNGEWKYVWD